MNTPPVKEGDQLRMECVGIGAKGDGICKHKGYVVIVPEARTGQSYNVRITRTMEKFGFGEIVR